MAGVMNLVRMSASVSSFLFMRVMFCFSGIDWPKTG